MRITRLKLKNCGLHAELELACDSPIVGVCGVNGSGKSTVLEMIRYALTGETNDNIDTYVRHGAGNGSVEVTFRKHGKEHTVLRQFGKTPKRSLTSGTDAAITKVKEIDSFLTSLLGADRLTMNSAVFIGQGRLSGMLFQGEADRRSLFIQMVNLGFCASRASAALELMAEVGAQVANLEPVLVSAEELLRGKETELALLLTRQADVSDWSSELKELGERQRLSGQRDELYRQLQQNQQTLLIRQGQLLERHPQAADAGWLTSLEQAQEARQRERRQLSEILQRHTRLAEEARQYRELLEEQSQLKQDIASTQVELNGMSADVAGLRAAQTSVRERLQKAKAADQQRRREQELQELMPKEEKALAAAQAQAAACRLQLEELGRVVELANTELRLLSERQQFGAELRRCFAERGQVSRATCPKCQLTVVDVQIPGDAEMQQLDEQLRSLRVSMSHQKDRLLQLEQELRREEHAASCSQQLLNIHQRELEALRQSGCEDLLSSEDQNDLQRHLIALQDQERRSLTLSAQLGGHRTRWSQVMLKLTALKEWRTVPAEQLTPEALQQSAVALRQLDQDILAAQKTLQDLAAHLGTVRSLQETLSRQQGEAEELDRRLAGDLSERLDALLRQTGTLAAVQALVEDQQKTWQEAQQLRREAEAAVKAAREQVAGLRQRMQADQVRRSVLKDLGSLKELFAESGLPAKVVGHYFQQLTRVTRRHLNDLNANFRIEPDDQRPLTFRFERTDRQEGLLPMSKLSGGQKVRLCLAFLMAVQEVLVPNVGLLVLDEVSDSLDEEGVASLAELLRDMGGRLQNTDHQLWVVDHRQEIASALPVRLELGSPA